MDGFSKMSVIIINTQLLVLVLSVVPLHTTAYDVVHYLKKKQFSFNF